MTKILEIWIDNNRLEKLDEPAEEYFPVSEHYALDYREIPITLTFYNQFEEGDYISFIKRDGQEIKCSFVSKHENIKIDWSAILFYNKDHCILIEIINHGDEYGYEEEED